jgi:glucose-6-phosphate isomerase
MMLKRVSWKQFKEQCWWDDETGFRIDYSRMGFSEGFISRMEPAIQNAVKQMTALEKGAKANPDEKRMVGHYWLRTPERAPSAAITKEIRSTVAQIRQFASHIHAGDLAPERGEKFTRLLLVGIGGSALGPQLVNDALRGPDDPLTAHFFDNTDPDGMDRVLAGIGSDLQRTLTVVVSKSGSTPETRNGMMEIQAAYRRAGLNFGDHAVAVTGQGSKLADFAAENSFLSIFPMWDWVGGRTSVLSAVGLLPAALQGFPIEKLLSGARQMDELTRSGDVRLNPALLLALSWHHAGEGRGLKDMVVIPYKDRLSLFSRYLQQLVMESLGKKLNLEGNVVHQGMTVYGNKGSTDQHAYVQQLRDGIYNFFLTFIQVLEHRQGGSLDVEEGITSGDYLSGFLLGTRQALAESGRATLTITLNSVTPESLGSLIALFERAVGFYATMIGINAYHQPGVEAGKKAAQGVLDIQLALAVVLKENRGRWLSVEELARATLTGCDRETVFHILETLAANGRYGVRAEKGPTPFQKRYRID